MTHPNNHKNFRKSVSIFIVGGFSLFFLLLGLYLVLIRDPQTHTSWQTQSAISYITLATRKTEHHTAQAHIKAAHQSILLALTTSPYDPYLWIRLARIEKLLDHPNSRQIDKALEIAIRLKPSLYAQIQREGLHEHE